MNSETNGRKRKRYNTFRASHNPVPPKRTFRRHLKANSSRIPHDNPSSLSDIPVSTNVNLTAERQGYTCFLPEQNGNHLYEMHEDDVIFSANQSDSLMEDEDLQAKEIGEAYGKFAYSEEVVCSTGFPADFQRTEMQQDDVSDPENTEKEDDPPVYPPCPLRLSESILLIMTLAIRHNLTGDALADVIKLIDLHCVPGPNSHSVKTLRELKSYFANSKEALDLFYYCKCCYSLLPTERTEVCPICGRDLSLSSSKSYLVVLPTEHQLSKFLSHE